MDLRNQEITFGELMDQPRSRAVFQRRFGKLLAHPMAASARCLTLKQLCTMAAPFLPRSVIRDTLQELQQL